MSSEEIIISEEVKNYSIEKTKDQGYFSIDDLTQDFEDYEKVSADLKRTDNYKIVSVDKKEIYIHDSLTLSRFKELPNNIKDKLIEEGYSKRTRPNCNALDVLENVGVNGIPKTYDARLNDDSFVDVVTYIKGKLDTYKNK